MVDLVHGARRLHASSRRRGTVGAHPCRQRPRANFSSTARIYYFANDADGRVLHRLRAIAGAEPAAAGGGRDPRCATRRPVPRLDAILAAELDDPTAGPRCRRRLHRRAPEPGRDPRAPRSRLLGLAGARADPPRRSSRSCSLASCGAPLEAQACREPHYPGRRRRTRRSPLSHRKRHRSPRSSPPGLPRPGPRDRCAAPLERELEATASAAWVRRVDSSKTTATGTSS